jgi:hypothetical protein
VEKMKNNEKNNDIFFLQEWRKRKQASETAAESTDTNQPFVGLETFLQETDEEFDAEYGKDFLSGMLIW